MNIPLNCEVDYIQDFLSIESANELFDFLFNNFDLSVRTIQTIDGRSYPTDFGKIMFMDQNLIDEGKFPKEYWGATAPWPDQLIPVKEKVEQLSGHQFQVCVCVHYPDGNSGVDYHSDYVAYGNASIIPSLSLGEERVFKLREKSTQREHVFELVNGSLIIMGKGCQDLYEHSLPTDPVYNNPRINLTFRKFGFDN